MAKKWRIFDVLLSLTFLMFLFFNPYTYNWSDHILLFYSYLMADVILALFFLSELFVSRRKVELAKTDILLFIFALLAILSAVIRGYIAGNEQLLTFLTFCLLYAIVRVKGIRMNAVLITTLLLAFLIEFCLGIRQVRDLSPLSAQFTLSLTGSMDNSGLLCCFFVIQFHVLLLLCKYFRNRRWRTIYAILLLSLTVLMVILTKSRSSAIALAASIIFCWNSYGRLIGLHNGTTGRRPWISRGICLVGVLLLLMASLLFKTNSAIGRALIWRVSLPHVSEKPLLGVGYGRFPIAYQDWQAAYFKQNEPAPIYKAVADVNYEIFNEPFQILLEMGLPGLLIFISLAYVIFRLRSEIPFQPELACLKGGLLSLLLVSLFSYPFHSTPILFLSLLLLGTATNVSNEKGIVFEWPSGLQKIFCSGALCFVTAYICLFSIYTITIGHWLDIKKSALVEDKKASLAYSNLYQDLDNNGLFLFNYGESLYFDGDFVKCIEVLERSRSLYINEKTYDYLGLAYQKCGKYNKAGECFEFLAHLVPNRLRPNYLLARLYLQEGDTLNARRMADVILHMPVKIPSDEVNNIKLEMSNLLLPSSQSSVGRSGG